MKANSYCNDLNATMVFPTTNEEYDAIRWLMTEYGVGNEIWTALKLGKSSSSCQFVSEELLYYKYAFMT